MAYPSNRPDEDVQFLFDECVTPRLVQTAAQFGYFGQHVVSLGLASASDDVICARAIETGRILVTNNGKDFRQIYRRFRRHPGLVILLPSVRWSEQVALFEKLLRFIENEDALIDRVVEIRSDGKIILQPWPVT
jgi:predicted nuclease of predicted toxin-antitoxin system